MTVLDGSDWFLGTPELQGSHRGGGQERSEEEVVPGRDNGD